MALELQEYRLFSRKRGRDRRRVTCLVLLRVKVVISDNGDVEARTQGLFELCGAFRF